MTYQDPRIDPTTANVIDHDVHQTFTQRSLRAIAGIAIALFFMGGIVSWFFMGDRTVDDEEAVPNAPISEAADVEQAPGNEYAEGSGRGAMYDFFYTMFGGIEQGLEENPHNLDNVDHIDQFNINAGDVMGTPDTKLALEDAAAQAATKLNAQYGQTLNTEHAHSIQNIVGSRVKDKDGQETGKIFDILVNKETGAAKAIVVQDDKSYYQRDLKAVGFNAVDRKQDNGDTVLTVTENTFEKAKEFEYTDKVNETFVSLLRLQDGELIDFEGKVAGSIDTVIYENAEAQDIFFTLRPALSAQGAKQFKLPFDKAEIVETPDGLDVQLTEKQTRALASMLFTKNTTQN
ncbi:MAG: hypothetical protein JKY71_04335 [Alphaproteobacteria bacterium]|nr:hypothetical protein [Alphaproteobacteria bacterium]